jgi:hypothetical protein
VLVAGQVGAHVARLASVCEWTITTVGRLRLVGTGRHVSLADSAALFTANPFAGIKVRGNVRSAALDTSHAFTEGEWSLVRVIADCLEWSYGWQAPAAQRLRFLLDFAYATALRASEFVGAKLGDIHMDHQGDHWLHLVGKGSKAGKSGITPDGACGAGSLFDRAGPSGGTGALEATNAADRGPRVRCDGRHHRGAVVGDHATLLLGRGQGHSA